MTGRAVGLGPNSEELEKEEGRNRRCVWGMGGDHSCASPQQQVSLTQTTGSHEKTKIYSLDIEIVVGEVKPKVLQQNVVLL